MKVPLLDLKGEYQKLRDEILPALHRVCQNSAFVLGEDVNQFEREFADYCQVKHCVALGSGTAALHLGLLALGVQPGDEVITSTNTFLATAEAITYCGARPVFVDIQPATANLDPRRIERAITSRTRAIIPIHLYGRPADMDAICSVAQAHKLHVLEDAAQAHGARYRRRRVGGLADAAAFSFYPTKNLAAYGEAGALTTNDDQVAAYARAARSHGQTARYEHEFVGYNYRMDGATPENCACIPERFCEGPAGNACRSARGRVRVPPVCDLHEQPKCSNDSASKPRNRNNNSLPEAAAPAASVFVFRIPALLVSAGRARKRACTELADSSRDDRRASELRG